MNRTALVLLLSTPLLRAQLLERPGNSRDDPVEAPRDLTGMSLKNPRIRVVHTTDADLPGGSMWLQQRDPWLGWQWGRSLFQREFREADGVYGDAGLNDGPLLPDGATHMQSRSHVNSCAVCHNIPYRDAGAGATIAKNGGLGRTTPHLYGGGLMEMIGQQMRAEATRQADVNRDGWISLSEAKGRRCIITPVPGAAPLDCGSFEDTNGDGWPDLDLIFHPVLVDSEGVRMPTAPNLKEPGAAGFRLDVQVFGFGHLRAPNRAPIASTVRAFAVNTFDLHMGVQPYDPACLEDDDQDGWSRPTNAGCPQPATMPSHDRGAVLTKAGISRDDPDRDGYCHEMSCGELDMLEWYALNHPRPGRGRITDAVKAGEQRFASLGCAACHVPDWHIAEDRRFFDLEVAWSDKADRMEGRLVNLSRTENGRTLPARRAFQVPGLYSDFRYHDMGESFAQMQYDGSIVRRWRTTPLWGAGSTAPYGHDGASLTLDAVIRRHGGEAAAAAAAYAALTAEQQSQVTAFLESLVLYSVDQLPCDIDGDGRISTDFVGGGRNTGMERLNPEWLFRIPGIIEGEITNPRGEPVRSFALTNVAGAYGLDLEFLRDRDGDTFPDRTDDAPDVPGVRDGVK